MRKDWMCAVLLAASSICAQAQETTWNFSYQGFLEAATGEFLADQTLTGSFTGADDNADGVITVDELSYLSAGNYTYLAPNESGCVHSTSPYIGCSIGRFTYALTGGLDFSVGYSGNDEFFSGWYGSITTGDAYVYGRYGPLESYEDRYEWTDQTTFVISPPPVPEPAALLMFPAGMAVLALARRRRKVSL